jgi:hypothetical protein
MSYVLYGKGKFNVLTKLITTLLDQIFALYHLSFISTLQTRCSTDFVHEIYFDIIILCLTEYTGNVELL